VLRPWRLAAPHRRRDRIPHPELVFERAAGEPALSWAMAANGRSTGEAAAWARRSAPAGMLLWATPGSSTRVSGEKERLAASVPPFQKAGFDSPLPLFV